MPTQLENYRNFGVNAKVEAVRASKADNRKWLEKAPVCPGLSHYSIWHTGVMTVEDDFSVSRAKSSGSFLLVTLEGEGQVLVDGRWKKIKAGQACLLPAFVANALKSVKRSNWKFCWVRYLEPKNTTPVASSNSPVTGAFEGNSLELAISGLIQECRNNSSPAAIHHWIELIQLYTLSFAKPHNKDERLWKLWNVVSEHLEKDWTLNDLAQLANVSAEHLRRLSKKHQGRSPMQQLTFLRMKRASDLLSTTNEKIEVISKAVGYQNSFHFSNVFVKWVGCRPSNHRK